MIGADVTIGQLVPLIVLAVGAIGAFVTVKVTQSWTSQQTAALGTRLDKTDGELEELRRHVDRNCVEKSDLREVEGRINGRIADVEHTFKQVPMQVVGLLNAAPVPASRRPRVGG
jgi:hypothetical protein